MNAGGDGAPPARGRRAEGPRSRRALFALAGPDAVARLGSQLLGLADSVVVAFLGVDALAGLTAAIVVASAVSLLQTSLVGGMRIAAARHSGARDARSFGAAVRAALLLTVGTAVAATVGSAAFAWPVFARVLPHGVPYGDAAAYLVARCASLVPGAVSATLLGALASSGVAKFAPRHLAAVNAVHLPALLVLVFGAGPLKAEGLPGAGLASLAAECAGLCYVGWVWWRSPLRDAFATWRTPARAVRLVAFLSFSDLAMTCLYAVIDVVFLAMLIPLGAGALAAYRVLDVANGVANVVPWSLGDALEILLAQRLGAGRAEEAEACRRALGRTILVLCLAFGSAIAASAWPLARLIGGDAAVAAMVAGPLALHVGATQPLKALGVAAISPLRAAGDMRFVFAVEAAGAALAGVLGAAFLALHAGLWAVPLAWIPEWVFRGTFMAARARRGRWLEPSPAMAESAA